MLSPLSTTPKYVSFLAKDVNISVRNITNDLRHIAEWCCSNQLLINPSKTKLIVFGSWQMLAKLPEIKIPFLGKEFVPANLVMDFGVTFHSHLTFNDHTTCLTSSLLAILCQISKVKYLFSKESLKIILNSLVFSKLFYCSTVCI